MNKARQIADILGGVLLVIALIGLAQLPILPRANAERDCQANNAHCYASYHYATPTEESQQTKMKNGIYGKILVQDPGVSSWHVDVPQWIRFPDGHWIEMGYWEGGPITCGGNSSPEFYVFWMDEAGPHCERKFQPTVGVYYTLEIRDQWKDGTWDFLIDNQFQKTGLPMTHSSGNIRAGSESAWHLNTMNGHWNELMYITTYSDNPGILRNAWDQHYCSDDSNHYYVQEFSHNEMRFWTGAGICP